MTILPLEHNFSLCILASLHFVCELCVSFFFIVLLENKVPDNAREENKFSSYLLVKDTVTVSKACDC